MTANPMPNRRAIYLKTPQQLEQMRAACRLTSATLGEVARWVKPGITTQKLDTIAREFILDHGGRPACLGYEGFPGTLCIEVNETVVHGFPGTYTLREGDIVGTDLVVELDGWHGDMCYTFAVGELAPEVDALCRATLRSLQLGIDACREGRRIGDISNAVQTYCERHGYTVVHEMCGHGIGRRMHEEPEVPNYGRRGTGPVIRNGLCIAIEPMVNLGSRNVTFERDGWTCRTRDRKPSAHFEHTVAVVDGDAEQLTSFAPIEEALGDRAFTPAPLTDADNRR